MSGFASGFPLLSTTSNVSVGSHGGVWLSTHLSGTVNGLTHVIAFAGCASAVASAPMSTVSMPKMGAKNVVSGLPRRLLRSTRTRTCVGVGKLTSSGSTEAWRLMTPFSPAVAAAMALRTAGPVAERSLGSL
jgi:hypothetical protein